MPAWCVDHGGWPWPGRPGRSRLDIACRGCVGEGEGVDGSPEQGAGDIGDHDGRSEVGGEDAVADDQLLAVQGVDHAAGGARALDQFLPGDAEPVAVPFGVDESGPADNPALRWRGLDPAAVSAGASLEIHVAERERQRARSCPSLSVFAAAP